ncbi:MAG TPA: cytochrome c biogenesis protein CcdA, partial [Patescibacteria group bacterium]|nr:cytochrome c biogenesis protein CcdA [Patescibacteria group bacterium]
MMQILFAVLAGVLTVTAPCILPMLPILLGASVGRQSRRRPLLIVSGFIISFAAASLILSALIDRLGLSPNTIRNAAIIILAVFAVFMIWPRPFELLALKMSGAINKASQAGKGPGNASALLLGLILGIVWTPCAGPVLGAILTLIAAQGTTAKAAALVVAYALGAGTPMLIIAYGSQWLTAQVRWLAQYAARIQQVFGVLVLLLAAAMYFQYDTLIENRLTALFPQSSLENRLTAAGNPINNYVPASQVPAGMPQISFQNYGPAPDFTGIDRWLNSDPLTIKDLRGKVVLVDFWTFSCINCIRTLPYVTKWYDTYENQGLVVVGVHTPEFGFEKDTGNVSDAIKRFNIRYPVAQDNEYATWNAYNNEYWPAEYLINQNGEIVHEHFGEGDYDVMENAIRELLKINTAVGADNGQNLSGVQSPEMYFEPDRLQYLTPDQQQSSQPQEYTFTQNLALNNFALQGQWQFNQDHARLTKGPGAIRLKFSSGKVY